MILSISSRHEFDAAHYLPDYQGRCSMMHGHRWVVEFDISTELGEEPEGFDLVANDGMLIDFNDLAEAVDMLDHDVLNEHVANPTAECIALWFWDQVTDVLPLGSFVVSVTVWESPANAVSISEGVVVEPKEGCCGNQGTCACQETG